MNHNFSEEDIKKVAKGAGTSLIGSSIGRGLFFLSQVIIARILGVEAFGLYVLGFSAIKICEIIARFGLNTGGMRFVSV
jgi:O-antigen/teichoic acid export membrane protein